MTETDFHWAVLTGLALIVLLLAHIAITLNRHAHRFEKLVEQLTDRGVKTW